MMNSSLSAGESVAGPSLDDVERQILEFLACRPFVLSGQVRKLLDLEAARGSQYFEVLMARGLIVSGPRLQHQKGSYQITRSGLDAIGSDLPVPRLDLRRYLRDLIVTWLYISARRGVFAPIEAVFTDREMRVIDRRLAATSATHLSSRVPEIQVKLSDPFFRLELPAVDPKFLPTAHYPDLVVVEAGGRVAMEVILAPPSVPWLTAVLEAYTRKASVGFLVFFVQDEAIAATLRTARAAAGLDDWIRVEKVTMGFGDS